VGDVIGAMVCLLAASWVPLSVSAGCRWPHNALRHHWLMPISCHIRDCKALLFTSLTHVSGAITSVQTFTFTVYTFHCCFITWLSVDVFDVCQLCVVDGQHKDVQRPATAAVTKATNTSKSTSRDATVNGDKSKMTNNKTSTQPAGMYHTNISLRCSHALLYTLTIYRKI